MRRFNFLVLLPAASPPTTICAIATAAQAFGQDGDITVLALIGMGSV